MASAVEQQTLHPGVCEEEEGPESCQVLEKRGVSICSGEENKELQRVLEVGIEEPLGNTNLGGEQYPLILVVEARNQTDEEELKWEADDAQY